VLAPREIEALEYGARERVTDLHLPHVRDLPRVLPGLFADAAERAVRAGFDGVELHYAHAYTMASFLSARNDRSDGYGGPRECRARGRLRDPDSRSRRDHELPSRGRGPRTRRRGRHRRRATEPRRPRLVPEGPPRARRGGPALQAHELLRGARSTAQAGHLPAL